MLKALEVLTPPEVEPYDIDTIKRYLRIPNITVEDDILYMMMSAVRAKLERELRRAFLTQTLRATFLPDKAMLKNMSGVVVPEQSDFRLPHPPFQALTLMEVENIPGVYSPIDPTSYRVHGDILAYITVYPAAFNQVELLDFLRLYTHPQLRMTYKAGYSSIDAIPYDHIQLLYSAITTQWMNRDNPEQRGNLNTALRDLRVPHL